MSLLLPVSEHSPPGAWLNQEESPGVKFWARLTGWMPKSPAIQSPPFTGMVWVEDPATSNSQLAELDGLVVQAGKKGLAVIVKKPFTCAPFKPPPNKRPLK